MMEISRKDNIRRWLIVAMSFMIMFLIFATCISCMGIYIKPVSEEFGISRTAFSLTITIGSLAMMLSAIIAGKLMDKINMKLLMSIGVLMCGGSMFIYSIASSIMWFYAGAVLMGCAVSLTCNIPISLLLKEWFRDGNQGLALGIAFVGSGAGAMILNPSYSHIIQTIGWRTSYRFAAILIIAVLIPLILLLVKRTDTGNDNAAVKTEDKTDMITLTDALKMPATWGVFIGLCIVSFVNMVILNQGVPYMTDNGMTPEAAAKVISTGSGALILGKIVVGRLIDKIGIHKATVITAAALLLAVAAMWASGISGMKGIILIMFAVGYAIGATSATVGMPVMVSHMFGKCDFGAIMGLFSMSGGAGGMLQIIVSAIYEATGNYNYAWATVAAVTAVLIILMVLFLRPQKKHN